jgi:NtrC-family two-component system response regulator AlgB
VRPGGGPADGRPTETPTLDQLEAAHIQRVLAAAATLEEAAAKLGIDPSTLYRKRKKYGI